MSVVLAGNAGVASEVEANTRALRTTPRPIDVGSLGSYSIAGTTGTVAAGAAANSLIFTFRWTSATNTALIRKVTTAMASLGTGFTAGVGSCGIIFARGFTVADTGGTTLTITGNNAKRRTSFGTTTLQEARISTTAALTAGTRTLDAQDLALTMFAVSAATNTVMLPTTAIWSPDFSGEWPMVLAQNEGFSVRYTVPATGTWQAQFGVEWSEVVNANF